MIIKFPGSVRISSFYLMLPAVLSLYACTHSLTAKDPESLASRDGRWRDLGTIVSEEPLKLSLTARNAYALSGSTLYTKSVESDENWKEIETFDDELADIYTISGTPDVIILTLENAFETLPLRISHDGGRSFQEYGSEFTDQPEKIGAEYEVPRHFFREETGKLFASLSGLKTAVSTDSGRSWAFALGDKVSNNCVGGESRTITLPSHPGVIFKTEDCPLKSTSVASIQTATPELKLEKLIDESFLGEKTPNTLAASAALPDTLFVGVEDGVLRYDVREKKSDWLIEAKDDQEWSGYFTQIWVDPADSDHLVISGVPKNSKLEFLLFESNDNGKSFQSLRSPKDPQGIAQSSGGTTFGNRLVIAAKEEENNPRIWLFDLKGR